MRCCVECFKDIHIRSTIEKQGAIGDCDYCSGKSVAVYDISRTPNPISDAIIGLVQIYSVSDLSEAKPLSEALRDDWDMFNVEAIAIQKLVIDLCGSVIGPESEILQRMCSLLSFLTIFMRLLWETSPNPPCRNDGCFILKMPPICYEKVYHLYILPDALVFVFGTDDMVVE